MCNENKPTDFSGRAIKLARMIDRLPVDSTYVIKLKKPDTKDQRWIVEFIEVKAEEQKSLRTTEM